MSTAKSAGFLQFWRLESYGLQGRATYRKILTRVRNGGTTHSQQDEASDGGLLRRPQV